MAAIPPPVYPTDRALYKLRRRINNGSDVFVFEAYCIPKEEIVAIKILNLDALDRSPDTFLHQLDLLRDLPDHPNILKPYCSFVTDDRELWVVMPFVASGSIQSIISVKFPNGLWLTCIASIAKTVLKALDAIHRGGLVHRGVKPGNILLTYPDGKVLLSDFGVSSWYYDDESRRVPLYMVEHTQMDAVVIPPYWVPPEAIEPNWKPPVGTKPNPYNKRGDIWSLGITMLELFHGRPPVTEFPMSKFSMRLILKRFHFQNYYLKLPPMRPYFFTWDWWRNILNACLCTAPERRPDANELMAHDFFKGRVYNDTYLILNLMMGLDIIGNRIEAREALPRVPLVANTGPACYPVKRFMRWDFRDQGMALVPQFTTPEIYNLGQGMTLEPQVTTTEFYCIGPEPEDPHTGYSTGMCNYETGLDHLSRMLDMAGQPVADDGNPPAATSCNE